MTRRRIPIAEWYYALNNENESWAGPLGPGKNNAYRELRRLRRQLPCEGPFRLVPEDDLPPDTNHYPE